MVNDKKIYIVNDAGHNYSSALEYTSLPLEEAVVRLTNGTVNIFDTDRLLHEMVNILKDFNVGDLLLLSGGTILNIMACLIIFNKFERVDVLVYNQLTKAYAKRSITKEDIEWQVKLLTV